MDAETLAVAIGYMKAQPNNALVSAEAAAASATAAQEAADSVESATVEETKTYLGLN